MMMGGEEINQVPEVIGRMEFLGKRILMGSFLVGVVVS